MFDSLVPLRPDLSEPEALYYLLTLIKKKKKGSTGLVSSSYQEATWGDLVIIQDLATQLSSSNNQVNDILNAASIFGMTIEHFQIIRNAQIHVSKSNMNKLQSVIPYYVIASKPQYPHDVIEARELKSGKVAIKAWIESMNDFLGYL